MNNIFENAIANVNAAYPSIYTKDDVIKLLTDLQKSVPTEKVPAMDLEALEVIKQNLLENIERISLEDCVELELSYDNRIEISINERMIVDEAGRIFDEAIEEMYPKETKK